MLRQHRLDGDANGVAWTVSVVAVASASATLLCSVVKQISMS